MNFHGVCRICETTKDLELIFNEENAAIVCMLRSLAHYPIGINDRLSQYICTVCTQSLKLTYNFKSLYQMTYDKFKIMSLRNPQQNIKEMLSCNESVNPIEVAGSFTKTKIRKKRQVNIKSNCKIVEASTSISQLKNSTSTESVCSQDSKSTITGLNEVNPSMHVIGYEDGNIKEHIENRSDMVLKEETNNFNDGNGQVNSAQKVKSDERVEDSPSKSASINEEKLCSSICRICGIKFNRKIDLQTELQPVNSRLQSCINCEKIFSKCGENKRKETIQSIPEVFMHSPYAQRDETNEWLSKSKLYKCLDCGKGFKDVRCFTNHQVLHSYPDLYKCNECGKRFNQLQTYKNHKALHSNPKLYGCEECGKSFQYRQSLQIHKRTHTNLWPYKCDKCEKIILNCAIWKEHESWHLNPDRHKCDECGKSFTMRQRLKEHKRLHANPDLFKCEECGKSFSRISILKEHISLHLNPDRYKCTLCGKSFHQLENYLNHKALHLNPNLHECTECGKSFVHAQSLREHKLLHLNPDLFQCEMCGKRLASAKNLRYHKAAHLKSKPNS